MHPAPRPVDLRVTISLTIVYRRFSSTPFHHLGLDLYIYTCIYIPSIPTRSWLTYFIPRRGKRRRKRTVLNSVLRNFDFYVYMHTTYAIFSRWRRIIASNGQKSKIGKNGMDEFLDFLGSVGFVGFIYSAWFRSWILLGDNCSVLISIDLIYMVYFRNTTPSAFDRRWLSRLEISIREHEENCFQEMKKKKQKLYQRYIYIYVEGDFILDTHASFSVATSNK